MGVVGSEGSHRDEQTSLVVLEASLEIGNDRIAKLVAVGEELAEMRAPRQFIDAGRPGRDPTCALSKCLAAHRRVCGNLS
ncbi:hypothetical protein BJS_02273 [Bradyrhizobium japonicum SEMIA 5079]|nr:hypothetical protein BJS_02273 [Bradyrhizobium japonicum SEMIA 5079]